MTKSTAPPTVEIVGLSKTFGAVRALDDVSLKFAPGRVHALLGENGAGKSTLVKCLMGYYRADRGRILVDNAEQTIAHPRDAHGLGLGMVYQHFTLVPAMTVAENFVLGRADIPAVIDWNAEHRALRDFMDRMPFRLDPQRRVSTLAAGEKQKLEILKQLYLGRRFLILDEPTSVLTPSEADEVLGNVRRMADAAELTIVLITHKFREVRQFATDVAVLRSGRLVGVQEGTADDAQLAHMMFGSFGTTGSTRRIVSPAPTSGPNYLEISNVTALGDRGRPVLNGVDLAVRSGEIVGVAGVSGNGQKELVEVLANQREKLDGEIRVANKDYCGTRRQIRQRGVSLLTEEPLANAAVRALSVMDNLALRQFDEAPLMTAKVFLRRRAMKSFAENLIARFGVRTSSASAKLETLSGGNVQRAVLARELSRNVRLLILQNPCFGLDAASTQAIRTRILDARDQGAAVLLISEDLEEILELSDRVLVMSQGRITYAAARDDAEPYTIGRHMAESADAA